MRVSSLIMVAVLWAFAPVAIAQQASPEQEKKEAPAEVTSPAKEEIKTETKKEKQNKEVKKEKKKKEKK